MILIASMFLLAPASATPDCSYDAEKFVSLPFHKFDQDLTGGWRAFEYKGCAVAAAALLRRYRHQHKSLTSDERRLLSWHEGQVLAKMGKYNRAIPLLLAGVPDRDVSGFGYYARGTVAFLRRNKPALIAARSRLAAIPKPANWADKFTVMVDGKPLSISVPWPPNLNVLDGLIMCFEKPYSHAYSCQPLRTEFDAKSSEVLPGGSVEQ